MSESTNKRRQNYVSSDRGKKRKHFDLRMNGRGILITCGSPNYTREGMQELLTLLKKEISNSSTISSPPSSSTVTDIEKAVEEELKDIKESSNRFIPVKDLTKGVSFCQFSCAEDSPNNLVHSILSGLYSIHYDDRRASGNAAQTKDESDKSLEGLGTEKETEKDVVGTVKESEDGEEKNVKDNKRRQQKVSCRFISRIVPVEITCPPHHSSFTTTIKRVVSRYFPDSEVVKHPERFTEVEKGEGKEKQEEAETSAVVGEEDELKKDVPKKDDPKKTGVANGETKVGGDVEVCKEVSGNVCDEDPLEESFTPSFTIPTNSTWEVQFQKRSGMKTLDRTKVVNEIGEMVGGENYKVNLSQPEYTVLIEVNPTFCGISVVKDYHKLFKYNIHRICHPESEGLVDQQRKRDNETNQNIKEGKNEEEINGVREKEQVGAEEEGKGRKDNRKSQRGGRRK